MTTAEQLERTVPADAVGAEPRSDAASSAPAPAPTVAPGRERSRSRLVTLAVVVAALSPFLVGASSIVRRGYPAGALFGDRAILALTAGDAFRVPVLLGPYSRFYWHHPGPLYFYLLDLWSVVFGRSTVALVLGATAINAAAAVGILVLVARRGGRALLVWTAILLTAYVVAIEPIPFDIWNPSVTLLPFVVVLLLTWSITSGDWWAAPWLAFTASFVVQTHVGLAPGVAMALGFAVVVSVWQQRRRGTPLAHAERRAIRRSLTVSAAVAVVVWLPPVIQQLTTRDGNLTALLHFFTRPGSPHTLSDGIRNAGLQATLMVRSLFEPISLRVDTQQGLLVAAVISAAAFVVAVGVARKARATDAAVLLALVAAELVVGIYAVTKVVGPIQFYLVQWISAVGFVLWVAVGHATFAFFRTRGLAAPRRTTLVRAAAVVAIAVLCLGAIRAFPSNAGQVDMDLDVPNNRALFGYVPTAQLLAATRPGHTVVLRNDSVTAWEVLAADALLLEQHGRTVHIVETPVTRLLFDDALLVDGDSGAQVLSFRDRAHPHVRGGETLIARQGRWSIVDGAR